MVKHRGGSLLYGYWLAGYDAMRPSQARPC
jgi:hypothetical protein